MCQPVLEQLQRRHEAAHQDLRGGARRVLRQVRLLTNESAAAGHVTRARPLIGCYVAGSPTDHEQCGGGACPLEGGVSSPGEVTVALGGWRDDWLQTVTILHPDTGREVGIDSVDSVDIVDSVGIDSIESVDSIDPYPITPQCPGPPLPIWLADHFSVSLGGSTVLTCGGRSNQDTTLCWRLDLATQGADWVRMPE